MNSKDRVLTAIDHKKPDKIPVTNRFNFEVTEELKKILKIKSEDSYDLEVELGHDLLCTKEIGVVSSYSLEHNKQINKNEYICDFGIIKKKINYQGGFYLEITKNPLENSNNYSLYKFPDPNKQELLQKEYDSLNESIKKYGKTHAIVGGVTCTIFEGCCMLRGLSRVLIDLIENEDFLNDLMDKLTDYHYKVGENLIKLGVDVIYIGDDVGMQTGMLISPNMWRKYLKPRYDKLFRTWKKINKNIIFALHSDGCIEPIVPDLIEIGLDILNPVQPGTMNDYEIKRKYGNKLTFWGGINVQKTIPFGSAKDVVDEVKDRISTFSNNGGFIISSSHNVQPNIRSIDNTFIYYWACNKYGIYK
ncbi:MAG: hypothetical protein M1326_06500 [Cyanobacteria bacterium]|nr:hypothetical protein [Cyanobacteriota bacterium]